ncbi:GNAT family N-acetyltransferase [Luteimonas sp. XNQY3]|nr:GNAT family N-acetyltransferase [Luteimonas sp. XNQY3]
MARLAVGTEVQGKGYGRLLVGHVVNIALSTRQTLGVRVLVMDARDEGAARFYASHGFRCIVTIPDSLSPDLGRLVAVTMRICVHACALTTASMRKAAQGTIEPDVIESAAARPARPTSRPDQRRVSADDFQIVIRAQAGVAVQGPNGRSSSAFAFAML